MPIAKEAAIPNPALERFIVLIGEWRTQGTHPLTPGVIYHGRTIFEWIEGGAFLMMRSKVDEPNVPSGLAVFGSDNKKNEFWMTYFDERGISRRIETAIDDKVWTWWRDGPDFAQRFTGTFSADRRQIVGRGKMKKPDAEWEDDLSLTYTRQSAA